MLMSRSRFACLTVGTSDTVAEVIARLGQDALQTAFVLDEQGVLQGMVSNGDFRRFMLAGGAMGDPVTACMNTRFTRLGPDATRADFARCFVRGLNAVPRVDEAVSALLEDLDKEAVDFVPNYDNTETQPVVLPARYPNLLVNGAGAPSQRPVTVSKK